MRVRGGVGGNGRLEGQVTDKGTALSERKCERKEAE